MQRAAVAQAARAFQEGTNISNTLEMEALLYAAGSRQCNIASSFGIHEGENRIYLCCSPGGRGYGQHLNPCSTLPRRTGISLMRKKGYDL